jgi:hypothetical protein
LALRPATQPSFFLCPIFFTGFCFGLVWAERVLYTGWLLGEWSVHGGMALHGSFFPMGQK